MVVADLLLRDLARRPEMRQRLRHDGGLDAVAEIDAAIASGMQDLLDSDAAAIMDVAGDLLELRDEFVVEQSDLAEIGLTLAERVGIGALVGDDAAARAGDHLGSCELALGDEAVAGVVVGDAAGAVLDAVLDGESGPLNGLEQMGQLLLAGPLRHERDLVSMFCALAERLRICCEGYQSWASRQLM